MSVPTEISVPKEVKELFSSFGAGLIGSWLEMILYGLTLAQTYIYFSEYPQDRRWIKLLVCILGALNTLHTTFTAHAIYQILVTNAFNLVAITTPVRSLDASVGIHIIIDCLVLLFFVNLCFQLTAKKTRWCLTIILTIPIGFHFGLGVDMVVHMAAAKQLADFVKFTNTTTIPLLVTQVACDIVISTALCVILSNHRTAFKTTNTILKTLIIYAINRGLLMFLVAIAELLLIVTWRKSLWYVAAEFIVAGLYTNSLLATLNSRNLVRQVAGEPAWPLATIAPGTSSLQSSRETRPSLSLAIRDRLYVRNKVARSGGEEVIEIVDLKPTYSNDNANDKSSNC